VTPPENGSVAATRSSRHRLAGGRIEIIHFGPHTEALDKWLPIPVAGPGDFVPPVARIRIAPTPTIPSRHPDGPATLRLSSVRAWVAGDQVELVGSSKASGTIDLAGLVADLFSGNEHANTARELYSMLTLSAAFLLGRIGRALVHAAAVVAPDERARLLIGDAWSGKSTTLVTLIEAGWDWLSDDQVVLERSESGEVLAEGWARPFHLDEGWTEGEPVGRRRAVDPAELGPGRQQASAALGGLLFPRVESQTNTHVESASPAQAFEGLVRQSPWLLADPGAAPPILDLLRSTALLPAHRLVLGNDTFRRPERLIQSLAPCIAS
jgi:hypothetical protein